MDNVSKDSFITTSSEKSARQDRFRAAMEHVLEKLKNNPGSITTEDARRLSENYEARDESAARIISAVESFANANLNLHEQDPSLGQAPHTSILTVVKDLNAAVEISPDEVTPEALATTQSVVNSKCIPLSHQFLALKPFKEMQKAVSHSTAPNPDLETEFQKESVKIEPKVAKGTVTKAEADHLHSLEARAHGHTEKGGITAMAQSVVAKRERKMSLSNDAHPSRDSGKAQNIGQPHVLTLEEQSRHDKEANLHQAEVSIKPRIEHGTVTQAEADFLQSREARAHGQIEKGGVAASAQSLVFKKREATLSDRSNVSGGNSETDHGHGKEQSQHEKDLNLKVSKLAIANNAGAENTA